MKKTISVLLCVMLAFSAITMCIAGAAEEEGSSGTAAQTGTRTLEIYKNVNSQVDDGKEVDYTTGLNGATFTAYQIMYLGEDGLWYISSGFADFFSNLGEDYADLLSTYISSDSTSGYLTYPSTDELEALITQLESYISSNSITSNYSDTTAAYDESGTKIESSEEENETEAAVNGKATITIPYGIYLVVETAVPSGYTKSSQSFLVASTPYDGSEDTVPSIKAYPKNTEMELDKDIITGYDNGGNVTDQTESKSYSIGDTIDYIVTATIPDYDTQTLDDLLANDEDKTLNDLISYILTDTFSKGLTYDADSLKIVLRKEGEDDVELTAQDLTNETKSYDYKVTVSKVTDDDGKETGETTLKIELCFDSIYSPATGENDGKNYLGWKIVLTYSATLNSDAAVGESNKNGITLEYQNNPGVDSSKNTIGGGDNPDPDTYTDVYTYELDLTKLFNGSKLSDCKDETGNSTVNKESVKFTLVKAELDEDGGVQKDEDGKIKGSSVYVKYDETKGCYVVEAEDTKSTDEQSNELAIQNEDGTIKVVGLSAGTYVLTETSTADGYKLLDAPIIIIVKETTDDTTGRTTAEVKAYIGNESEKNLLTHLATGTNADGITTYNVGSFVLTVNNAKDQFNLPLTGGLGIILYTLAGAVVLALAIVIFSSVRKKKRSE